MASLDIELCSELSKNVEALTTTGKKELDQDLLKKIKKICKTSNDYVQQLYYLLMTQLNKDHAEIRYSTVLLVNEIFVRSHAFREMLLAEFQDFLELAAETDPDIPLPPPQTVAKDLKIKTLQVIQEWHAKFGEDYKRLSLGYKYLKHCKKVDFEDAQSRSFVQRQREREEQQKRDSAIAEKVNKAKQEMLDRTGEISCVLTQVENCCRILLPHPDEFFTEYDFVEPSSSAVAFAGQSSRVSTPNDSGIAITSKDSVQQEAEESDGAESDHIDASVSENLRQHGLHDRKYCLTIKINKESASAIVENEDNSPVVENLRDLYGQVVSQYLPMVLKWMKVFTAGNNCSDSLKKTIDLKQMLENAINKFKELKITPQTKFRGNNNSGDEDEEFEEVEEKEGYEPVILPHRRKEYGLDERPFSHASTSKEMGKPLEPRKVCLWDLKSQEEEDISDPTSRLSTLNALCKKFKDEIAKKSGTVRSSEEASNSKSSGSSQDSEKARKQKLLSQAPILPYDIDLFHWEDEKLEAPTVRQFTDINCVWKSKNDGENDAVSEESTAALRRRYIDFSGKFVPVKWSCRAPLPSGKLCPRKDRFKCPFHGPIIARDEQGSPVNPEDVKTSPLDQPSTSQESVPDWQDPELLRDIEAATGIDLKLPEKRKKEKSPKGKSKKQKKFPGLTNINAVQNTVRNRLEKKVLNRKSVKRVSARMDSLDQKRFLDKYGNQWNYAFQT